MILQWKQTIIISSITEHQSLGQHTAHCVLYKSTILSLAVQHGIRGLVPQLGIKSALPVLEAQSVNPWTVTEVPKKPFFKYFIYVDFSDLNI